MDSTFDEKELLLRAVFPENQKPSFWHNGKLSSAALKDKKGLSVTRTYDRTAEESVAWMIQHFNGFIVSISVKNCFEVRAHVIYCPSKQNAYHSEIHGSPSIRELSDIQALRLSRLARIEYEPILEYSI